MNLKELTSTQVAILMMLKAKDAEGTDSASIPGRIHLVKELFAFQKTDLGKVLLSELKFEADKFGPFDESIFAALDELTDARLVTSVASENYSKIQLTPNGKELANEIWKKVKPEIKELVIAIKGMYNHKSSEAVLKDIYAAYPEMAKNSVSKVARKYQTGEPKSC